MQILCPACGRSMKVYEMPGKVFAQCMAARDGCPNLETYTASPMIEDARRLTTTIISTPYRHLIADYGCCLAQQQRPGTDLILTTYQSMHRFHGYAQLERLYAPLDFAGVVAQMVYEAVRNG